MTIVSSRFDSPKEFDEFRAMLLQSLDFYHRVVVRQQNYPNQKEVHQVYVLKFGKKLCTLFNKI